MCGANPPRDGVALGGLALGQRIGARCIAQLGELLQIVTQATLRHARMTRDVLRAMVAKSRLVKFRLVKFRLVKFRLV